jgi:uncharacterized protein (TIGR02266 family)
MNTTTNPHATSHPSLAERRRLPRASLVTELSLYSGSNFYAGFTEDISEGGVFVASYAILPVGAQVSIELALPGGFEIRATGTVRWLRHSGDEGAGSEPPGMGIELGAIDEEDRLLIREFVANRSPYFFDRSDE